MDFTVRRGSRWQTRCEIGQWRRRTEMEKMGRTGAIACPKVRQWQARAGETGAGLRPDVLTAVVVFAVPDFEGRGDTAQIVDMPVQALGDAEMMAQPCAQAAGAERRADVDITTCRRSQRAESADGDTATSFNRQQ